MGRQEAYCSCRPAPVGRAVDLLRRAGRPDDRALPGTPDRRGGGAAGRFPPAGGRRAEEIEAQLVAQDVRKLGARAVPDPAISVDSMPLKDGPELRIAVFRASSDTARRPARAAEAGDFPADEPSDKATAEAGRRQAAIRQEKNSSMASMNWDTELRLLIRCRSTRPFGRPCVYQPVKVRILCRAQRSSSRSRNSEK